MWILTTIANSFQHLLFQIKEDDINLHVSYVPYLRTSFIIYVDVYFYLPLFIL